MSTLILIPSEPELIGLPRSGPAALRCGVGLVASALTASSLLAEHRPTRCLLAGLAGTRAPGRAPLGSVVVGTAVRNEAVGAGGGSTFVPLGDMGLPDADLPPDLLELALPDWISAGTERNVAAAAGDAAAPSPIAGVIGTVAATSATAGEAAARASRFPDVLVEEMEGHGVAVACAHAGVPLTIVRAVSNVAGDRDKAHWNVAAALGALDRVLQRLLDAPPPPGPDSRRGRE